MLKEDRFCPRCATPLEVQAVDGRERPVCSQCGHIVYYDPKLAAILVIYQDGRVLMVRRALEPGRWRWSLPGGYVDQGEVVERAAEREALEETGLDVKITGLVGLFSELGHPVVVAAFGSQMTGGELASGPEVLDVHFFPLDNLPPLAFPRDRQILEQWKSSTEESVPGYNLS